MANNGRTLFLVGAVAVPVVGLLLSRNKSGVGAPQVVLSMDAVAQPGASVPAQVTVHNPNAVPMNVGIDFVIGGIDSGSMPTAQVPAQDDIVRNITLDMPGTPGNYGVVAHIAYDGQAAVRTVGSIEVTGTPDASIVPNFSQPTPVFDRFIFLTTALVTNTGDVPARVKLIQQALHDFDGVQFEFDTPTVTIPVGGQQTFGQQTDPGGFLDLIVPFSATPGIYIERLVVEDQDSGDILAQTSSQFTFEVPPALQEPSISVKFL